MRLPRRSMCIRPARRSSFRWWLTVEAARARFAPSSPAQRRMLAGFVSQQPGAQQVASSRKIFSRWGCPSALKAAASASTSV
ncbi:MAG TPA: hypothetical protein PK668_26785 [Myxococcota bacterium]|nr:hypothetical protein [Myxococcota bacterium]HRY97136.1 hypothetical protein [Myxococcota bacterium]HSA24695.1 hypothetical protein [Myxococcota bacterium]